MVPDEEGEMLDLRAPWCLPTLPPGL